jgi:hypothetical protein
MDCSPIAIDLTAEYRRERAELIHRYIARKPTTRERLAVNAAASLAVRYRFATTDRSINGDELVKLLAAAAARGLVRVLGAVNKGDLSKANSIGPLTEMLPRPVQALGGGPVDLTKLTDDELDQLEGMVAKAGISAARPPDSDAARIRELLDMNEALNALVRQTEERATYAAQGEATALRLRDQAIEASRDMQARLEAVEAAARRVGHGADSGQQKSESATVSTSARAIVEPVSNVVPIDRRGTPVLE